MMGCYLVAAGLVVVVCLVFLLLGQKAEKKTKDDGRDSELANRIEEIINSEEDPVVTKLNNIFDISGKSITNFPEEQVKEMLSSEKKAIDFLEKINQLDIKKHLFVIYAIECIKRTEKLDDKLLDLLEDKNTRIEIRMAILTVLSKVTLNEKKELRLTNILSQIEKKGSEHPLHFIVKDFIRQRQQQKK